MGLRRRHITDKATFALGAMATAGRINLALRRKPLPEVVQSLGHPTDRPFHNPRQLTHWVDRSLRLGPFMPRCVVRSLVLYHYLRREGWPAEIVIGLPDRPADKNAHAWIEVDGQDVGPPPGRGQHVEMARYP